VTEMIAPPLKTLNILETNAEELVEHAKKLEQEHIIVLVDTKSQFH
jgi:hypothetical protein